MSTLIHRLRGARVYLDTNAFIYFLQSTPTLGEHVASLLEASEQHQLFACTGEATIAELLVKPLRDRNTAAIGVIDSLFEQQAMIEVLPHSRNVFRLAASLRGERQLRFIDALHLATAITHRCAFFVTNDADFKASDAIEVVHLFEL